MDDWFPGHPRVELPVVLEPDPPGPGVLVAGDPEAPAHVDVPVRLVPDSSRNFKITTAEDLELAELLAGAPR